jgi:hypothetical protein
MFFGNKSSRGTPKTRDKKSISQSGTRRRCNSKLAKESRLTFQPRSWSFVARDSCVQPFLTRHFLTCGPIRFNAFVTAGTVREPNENYVLASTQARESSCTPRAKVLQLPRAMNLGHGNANADFKEVQDGEGIRVGPFLLRLFNPTILRDFFAKLTLLALDGKCPTGRVECSKNK